VTADDADVVAVALERSFSQYAITVSVFSIEFSFVTLPNSCPFLVLMF